MNELDTLEICYHILFYYFIFGKSATCIKHEKIYKTVFPFFFNRC